MPNIPRHGGASNHRIDGEQEPADESTVVPAAEGGEEPSPGSSSSTSTGKQQPTSEKINPEPPKRARTTGSRSRKARTGGSIARSTDIAQTAATSETGSDDKSDA